MKTSWKVLFREVFTDGRPATALPTGEGQAVDIDLHATPTSKPDPQDPSKLIKHPPIALAGTDAAAGQLVEIGEFDHAADTPGVLAGSVTYKPRPTFKVVLSLKDKKAKETKDRRAEAQAAGDSALANALDTSADKATWEAEVKSAVGSFEEYESQVKITEKPAPKGKQGLPVTKLDYRVERAAKEFKLKIAAPITPSAKVTGTQSTTKKETGQAKETEDQTTDIKARQTATSEWSEYKTQVRTAVRNVVKQVLSSEKYHGKEVNVINKIQAGVDYGVKIDGELGGAIPVLKAGPFKLLEANLKLTAGTDLKLTGKWERWSQDKTTDVEKEQDWKETYDDNYIETNVGQTVIKSAEEKSQTYFEQRHQVKLIETKKDEKGFAYSESGTDVMYETAKPTLEWL